MPQDKDLNRLDELIVRLGGSNDAGKRSGGPCGLMLEHLQTARRSLLGSMPGEYRMSLQQAKESVACIPDKSARSEIERILRSLLDSKVQKQGSSPVVRSPDHVPASAVPLARPL